MRSARRRTIRRRRCSRAVRALKREVPGLLVVTDVCLCEYTSHGHCGILDGEEIVNDATVEQLARAALSHADAGADIVAPSDMMDGRVGRIRDALDDARLRARSASCPTPRSTARRSTVRSAMPPARRRRSAIAARIRWIPANVEEALREVALDIEEGADIVMVKPALTYLDVIARVKARVRPADRRVSRQRRVRDVEGGGAERLDRRAAGDDGDADVDQARRRGHHHHVLRAGGRARAVTAAACTQGSTSPE